MPKIRIERHPVKAFMLGAFGFDHLQLVFQFNDAPSEADQDGWLLIEGLREPTGEGVRLSVEGWEGSTSLSEANGGAAGEDLIAKIRTPPERGSRVVPFEGDEHRAWQTMASFAGDIEAQGFPYIATSLPGSPLPTINSSSLVSSLLYYAGVDISEVMPFGVRLSPGTTTLLGSSGDDRLRIMHSFTTLVGGEGRDSLDGSDEPGRIDKLYGGKDDDRFRWSSGFNIVHGGQPELAYADDGKDLVSYAGAGTIRIDANPNSVPHRSPDYIVTTPYGVDHLYSIECVAWNPGSDVIVLGKGVSLREAAGAGEVRGPEAQNHEQSSLQIYADLLQASDVDEFAIIDADDLWGDAADHLAADGPGADASDGMLAIAF